MPLGVNSVKGGARPSHLCSLCLYRVADFLTVSRFGTTEARSGSGWESRAPVVGVGRSVGRRGRPAVGGEVVGPPPRRLGAWVNRLRPGQHTRACLRAYAALLGARGEPAIPRAWLRGAARTDEDPGHTGTHSLSTSFFGSGSPPALGRLALGRRKRRSSWQGGA